MLRRLLALLCAAIVLGAAWLSARGPARPTSESPASTWVEVAPGVLRSPGLPAGYALLSGDRALLIDAPCAADGLNTRGIKHIEGVLLTHHHRDTASRAARYLAAGVPV